MAHKELKFNEDARRSLQRGVKWRPAGLPIRVGGPATGGQQQEAAAAALFFC